MAAIDKTYLYRWEDYEKLENWCKQVGTVIDDYGLSITPLNWLWTITKEEFEDSIHEQVTECLNRYQKGEYLESLKAGYITQEEYDNWDPLKHIWGIPVWNTSTRLDIFLIRNCPLEFIQNRLKEQYGDGWSKDCFQHGGISLYESIKNKTSPYDTFERNGLGKNIKVNKKSFPRPFHIKGGYYYETRIQITFPDDSRPWYYESYDYWPMQDEEFKYSKGCCSICELQGHVSPKALFRKFQKWDLPKGTKVYIEYTVRRKKERMEYYHSKTILINGN